MFPANSKSDQNKKQWKYFFYDFKSFCSKNDEELADYSSENGGCMEMVVIRASTACHEHDKRLHLGTLKKSYSLSCSLYHDFV